ncbi:UDP-3-O-(3-hydroxymyristoyl)glucosamine N-acyltransferase [Candidatus Nitrosocosmicus franklandus]|uniref:UDP-3-O-(3-hydroxymyristoyl)glucosamine N-acyltransferase n=1 Tax=Candidatus Nitrosocosmicus franklandianus TaxID=1798806 RepID=A0A484IAA8_9ARCH|nr:UDP-3-O-(3-hydroxymyristoyl)glucosamine N-acyltransferase [Candidatus Nitrosocosmicus franklandus]VFJ13147.1 UDP-3-O-(3-hydroxymyristoyl)glucosamine N-acyltransferase [Candidatus Nitrosocosmicus franklandus]
MVQWTVESLLLTLVDSNYSVEGPKSLIHSKSEKGVSSLHNGTSTDVTFCQAEAKVSSEESQDSASDIHSNAITTPTDNASNGGCNGNHDHADIDVKLDNDNKKGTLAIAGSNAGVILCKKSMIGRIHPNKKKNQVLVFVDNPRFEFTRIAKRITRSTNLESNKVIVGGVISPTATIADSAKIGRDCYIGDHVVIGKDCIIGDNTMIESKVNLQNCIVGDGCIIQPNTTIGYDGFAFERCPDTLELEKFPHYGKVIIENDVEIYANCSIARGSLSDTVIGQGTKIDALCHVAHNVSIGKNTELTAGTIIGGSTTIGNNCWFGLNSTVKNKLKIGNKVIVGSGSSVINNIDDEDIVAGVPAKSIKNKITINKEKLFLMAGQAEHDVVQ